MTSFGIYWIKNTIDDIKADIFNNIIIIKLCEINVTFV